jgi:asparagine synthase (glutamine-hydrolysing)
MCGIVGVASVSPSAGPDLLGRMKDTLRHRGPDDEGVWWSSDRRVGLAHRRLAIIDLSPTGHQPMADSSGSLRITYNGELYNYRELREELAEQGHRFSGASDTEVLLAAYREWGTDCLLRFNGIFAFALHDRERGRLFLARDRVGEKPLFYRHERGVLAFASELKALMADPSFPRRLDPASLEFYLAYGYVPGERCMLRGVRKLAPAHAVTYEPDLDRLKVWRYWGLPAPPSEAVAERPAEERVDELESLLADSVRLRLIADVPTGILLSGGIDSSLVAALAVRVSSSDVRTFTVTFPGHPDHDEAPHARLVARHLGTVHTEVPAEPASLDLLPELARQYDEPMADSSMIPTYLLSRAVRPHAKVALGGDGGDELFAGYPHYGWIERGEALRRVLPRPVRQAVGAAAARWLPAGVRGRNHLIGLAGDAALGVAHVNLYFDETLRRQLVVPRPAGSEPALESPEAWRAGLCSGGQTLLQQATRADFASTLPDAYLVKVDRASMLASLEVRCPWLDHRLVELAFGGTPDRLRAGPDGRKLLPRRLARRLLPEALDLERKQGLSMPLDLWLGHGGAAGIEALLREADTTLFDRRVIEGLLAGQRRGLRNSQRLFALALFEQWRREYRVGVP